MKFSWLYLSLLCCILLAGGQLLFKLAAGQVKSLDGITELLLSLVLNGYLMLGLALYGLATLLWVWVLRDAPLSQVYPIIALSYLIVPFASMMLFGEPVNQKILIGGLLIVAGVYLSVS